VTVRWGGADLEALAEAAWFTAHVDVATEARERAFAAYSAEGDRIRAAELALRLAREYAYRGKESIIIRRLSLWMRGRRTGGLDSDPFPIYWMSGPRPGRLDHRSR
jgi:hypothetical protein